MSESENQVIGEWLWRQLRAGKAVSKADFEREFRREGKKRESLMGDWSRAKYLAAGLLKEQGAAVIDGNLVLTKRQPRQDHDLSRYANDNFDLENGRSAKEHIGRLVADFLKEGLLEEKTIFLGSGTTIFHVGLQMSDHRYGQRFVSANIALAAYWCARTNPPVSKVSIPKAGLETRTFRFSTMQGLEWPLTISVVGADGCFYDARNKQMVLYGNEESVAENTALFVRNTLHTVVFCLTSSKIKMGFAQNPNTGPPISLPQEHVIKVLVTDGENRDNDRFKKAVGQFEAQKWLVVNEITHWGKVLSAMKTGENADALGLALGSAPAEASQRE